VCAVWHEVRSTMLDGWRVTFHFGNCSAPPTTSSPPLHSSPPDPSECLLAWSITRWPEALTCSANVPDRGGGEVVAGAAAAVLAVVVVVALGKRASASGSPTQRAQAHSHIAAWTVGGGRHPSPAAAVAAATAAAAAEADGDAETAVDPAEVVAVAEEAEEEEAGEGIPANGGASRTVARSAAAIWERKGVGWGWVIRRRALRLRVPLRPSRAIHDTRTAKR